MAAAAPPRADVRRAWGFDVLVGGALLCAVLGRLSTGLGPFDHDSAMYIYSGKLAAQGARLPDVLCDNKFPWTALALGLFWRMLGTWWMGYVLVQTFMGLAGSLLLARLARRWAGPGAYGPTLVAALVFLNFNFVVDGGFQLETLQAFAAIIAACCAAEALAAGRLRWAMGAGAAAGCAALFKPNGLSVAAALAVATVFAGFPMRTRLRMLLALGAGIAIPAAAVVAYLTATDTLRDVPRVYAQVSAYVTHTSFDAVSLTRLTLAAMFIAFPIVVRGLIFRHRQDRAAALPEPWARIMFFAAVWLVVEFVGVTVQGRVYAYHFLVLAVPAALVYGLLPRKDRVFSVAAALGPAMVLAILTTASALPAAMAEPQVLPESLYLCQHARPGDAVWQDGMPRLLLETGLRPGARYFSTFIWVNSDTAAPQFSQLLLDDLARNRPRWVLLPHDLETELAVHSAGIAELAAFPARCANYVKAWHHVQDFVRSRYHLQARVADQDVYVLVE